MTEEAKAARNAYRREWYKKNPEKRKEYETRYWAKKAASERQEPAESGEREVQPDK